MRFAISVLGAALSAAVPVCTFAQAPPAPQTLPDPAPEHAPQQQPPTPAEQPAGDTGSGPQIKIGSKIGESTGQSLAVRIINMLADHQFGEIERMLDSPEIDETLTEPQRELYRGVLANRSNRVQNSIQMLEPLVDKIAASGNVVEEKLVRKTLAEDYLRAGDWSKAAEAYRQLDSRLGAGLSQDEKDEIELPLKLLPLAAGHPKMTVEPGEPFSLPYARNALGLSDVSVFVDGISRDWMLDPTAPFNLICRSTARFVGLKLSQQTATVHSITGRPMVVHATVIPRFTLGKVTFRNMTAFVFEDADYAFPRSRYQVSGVLGYPAVSALGSITVTQNSTIEVQPGDKGERLTGGARFYLDGDQILTALGRPGDERVFVVDAAGQQTYLSSRYYSEHAGDFASSKMQVLSVPGSASKPPAPAYVAGTVELQIGATPVNFHYIQVLTQPLGSAAVDDNYGILGMDALDELKSYTFDYRTMRFAVKTE